MAIDRRCNPRSGACITVGHLLCSYDLMTEIKPSCKKR
nr:hypothetical protein Iba_chr04dCG17210 [Ipomoea batatas]GME02196.1 hypothetical protein Iba_contig4105CG0010 [Ipomoea batatas]